MGSITYGVFNASLNKINVIYRNDFSSEDFSSTYSPFCQDKYVDITNSEKFYFLNTNTSGSQIKTLNLDYDMAELMIPAAVLKELQSFKNKETNIKNLYITIPNLNIFVITSVGSESSFSLSYLFYTVIEDSDHIPYFCQFRVLIKPWAITGALLEQLAPLKCSIYVSVDDGSEEEISLTGVKIRCFNSTAKE